jgi:trk system potassium uptake protein TrkH
VRQLSRAPIIHGTIIVSGISKVMGFSFVGRLLGVLFLLFSLALLPPIIVSVIYTDRQIVNFTMTLVACLSVGLLLLLISGKRSHRMQTRDGFLVVTLLWLFVSLMGAMPLMLALGLSPAAAFFESVSAFTTTGATVLSGLDQMPHSLLFYRQEMQWLGGIGVVVSAVALLPMLGVGGMQLYKAETAGPVKDEKLTPRIAHTARLVWRIYAGMTALCALLFWLAGMEPFDAIAHSLSTVSTGGFSTHDASLGYFNSPLIETIAIVFMLLGAISFNVHFIALRGNSLIPYWNSIEVRVFLLFTLAITVIVATILNVEHNKESLLETWRYAAFETVSVITSTGYGSDDFSRWPSLLPTLMIFISFVGGCAGSTAGGMKVIRFVLLIRQGVLEVQHLVHPKLVRPLKLGGRVIDHHVISAVWGFFAIYVATFSLFLLLLMADGMDQVSAFSAVATCMNNLGPGLERVATTFAHEDSFSLWLMGGAMLMGRLEIFTVLVLLSPAFWRR